MLIRAGIERLRELGSHLAFVLGHRDYYPRHGFIPDAGEQGYPAPYAPTVGFEDCWMVRLISPTGFGIGKGAIACCEAMNKPEHWRDDEADRVDYDKNHPAPCPYQWRKPAQRHSP